MLLEAEKLLSEEEEEEGSVPSRAMMVELEKQAHLQKVVGAGGEGG